MGDAGINRQLQCLGIHVCDHQKFAVARIGDDGGDQAVIVETRREEARPLKLGLVGGGGREF
ncbi:hypothetical protein D3C87_1939420 [compost metagenome]